LDKHSPVPMKADVPKADGPKNGVGLSGGGKGGAGGAKKPNAFAEAFQQLALKTKDAIKDMEDKAKKAKKEREQKKRHATLSVRFGSLPVHTAKYRARRLPRAQPLASF
jgi:hypothetical protein